MEKEEIEKAIKKAIKTFSESDDFHALTEWTKTNLFDVLKMRSYEIRHSNILAWLMNPYEKHGLRDNFLKKWLTSADVLKEIGEKEEKEDMEFSIQTEEQNLVNGEKGWIDILLVSEKCKVVICIENKINSSEHDSQLDRYHKYVCDKYVNYQHYFIYLTLNNETPNNFSWHAMSYRNVYDALCASIKESENNLEPDILMFLRHYQRTLELLMPQYGRLKDIQKRIKAIPEFKKAFLIVSRIWNIRNRPDIKKLIPQDIMNILERRDIIGVSFQSPSDQYASEINKWIQDKIDEGHIKKCNNKTGWIAFTTEVLEKLAKEDDKIYNEQQGPFSKIAYQIRNDLEKQKLANFSLCFYFDGMEGESLNFYREQYYTLRGKIPSNKGQKDLKDNQKSATVINFANCDQFKFSDIGILDFSDKLGKYLDRKFFEAMEFEKQYIKDMNN